MLISNIIYPVIHVVSFYYDLEGCLLCDIIHILALLVALFSAVFYCFEFALFGCLGSVLFSFYRVL